VLYFSPSLCKAIFQIRRALEEDTGDTRQDTFQVRKGSRRNRPRAQETDEVSPSIVSEDSRGNSMEGSGKNKNVFQSTLSCREKTLGNIEYFLGGSGPEENLDKSIEEGASSMDAK